MTQQLPHNEEKFCLSFLKLIQEEEATLGMLYPLESTVLRAIANTRWNLLSELQKEQYRKISALGLDSGPQDEHSMVKKLTVIEKTPPFAVVKGPTYDANKKVTRSTSPLRMPPFSELLKSFVR